MKVIVGLGNPGPRYETTRHNAGFLALDRLIDAWRADGPQISFEGEVFRASRAGESVLLVKPQTFMNLSGRCVGQLFKFYKCNPGDLTVIHDDLDLKPMTIRIKTGGGHGGHNGLKSIDSSLGSDLALYHRIRLGIGKPDAADINRQTVDYVLQPFSDEELELLDPLLEKVASAAEMIIQGDISGAMNRFNGS